MKKVKFPFCYFKNVVINTDNQAMTDHDPAVLLNLSTNEARKVRKGDLAELDRTIILLMEFSKLQDDDDFHGEVAFKKAQALAAIRNRNWYQTNNSQQVPDQTKGDPDGILWDHGKITFDNTDQVGGKLKPETQLESDHYIPRKVLEVTTNTLDSRGVQLTIEMIHNKITLSWKAKIWSGQELKERPFNLYYQTGDEKGLYNIFPEKVADRISYIYRLFMKDVCVAYTDLLFEQIHLGQPQAK